MLNPYQAPPESPTSDQTFAVGRSRTESLWCTVLFTLVTVVPPAVIVISRWLAAEVEGVVIGGVFGVLFVLIPPAFVSVVWIVASVFRAKGKPQTPLLLALLIFPTLPHCLYLLPKFISFFRLATQPGGFPFSYWLLVDGMIWMCLSVLLPVVFGKLVWSILASASDGPSRAPEPGLPRYING